MVRRPRSTCTSGWIRGSVVNAGDGTHEHPTQALLDAFTLRRRLRDGKGDLDGARVGHRRDVLHSRVARSNVLLLRTLGAEVTLVAPPTLLPVGVESWPCASSYDLDVVLPKCDAVMMLRGPARAHDDRGRRVLPEPAGVQPALRPRRPAGGDAARPRRRHAPGPMNRGMEIAAEVADGPRSTIVEQVSNGVSVRMAVLYLLLGGSEPGRRRRGDDR
jgi:aspartate carbamoyltransferase catalytic subunit